MAPRWRCRRSMSCVPPPAARSAARRCMSIRWAVPPSMTPRTSARLRISISCAVIRSLPEPVLNAAQSQVPRLLPRPGGRGRPALPDEPLPCGASSMTITCMATSGRHSGRTRRKDSGASSFSGFLSTSPSRSNPVHDRGRRIPGLPGPRRGNAASVAPPALRPQATSYRPFLTGHQRHATGFLLPFSARKPQCPRQRPRPVPLPALAIASVWLSFLRFIAAQVRSRPPCQPARAAPMTNGGFASSRPAPIPTLPPSMTIPPAISVMSGTRVNQTLDPRHSGHPT